MFEVRTTSKKKGEVDLKDEDRISFNLELKTVASKKPKVSKRLGSGSSSQGDPTEGLYDMLCASDTTRDPRLLEPKLQKIENNSARLRSDYFGTNMGKLTIDEMMAHVGKYSPKLYILFNLLKDDIDNSGSLAAIKEVESKFGVGGSQWVANHFVYSSYGDRHVNETLILLFWMLRFEPKVGTPFWRYLMPGTFGVMQDFTAADSCHHKGRFNTDLDLFHKGGNRSGKVKGTVESAIRLYREKKIDLVIAVKMEGGSYNSADMTRMALSDEEVKDAFEDALDPAYNYRRFIMFTKNPFHACKYFAKQDQGRRDCCDFDESENTRYFLDTQFDPDYDLTPTGIDATAFWSLYEKTKKVEASKAISKELKMKVEVEEDDIDDVEDVTAKAKMGKEQKKEMAALKQKEDEGCSKCKKPGKAKGKQWKANMDGLCGAYAKYRVLLEHTWPRGKAGKQKAARLLKKYNKNLMEWCEKTRCVSQGQGLVQLLLEQER